MRSAIGRDNLWITIEEQNSLAAGLKNGIFPESLARKIARFHLTDNTRGEPPMWRVDEIKSLVVNVSDDGVVTGKVHLETKDGKRGYIAALRGHVSFSVTKNRNGLSKRKLTQFDLVTKGKFWGDGPYTPNAPEGKFGFAVAIRLGSESGSKDVSDSVVPQAYKAVGPEAYRDP